MFDFTLKLGFALAGAARLRGEDLVDVSGSIGLSVVDLDGSGPIVVDHVLEARRERVKCPLTPGSCKDYLYMNEDQAVSTGARV